MAEASTAGWRHALLDVIGAALASVLAFVAVPAALVLVVGDPLAGGLGHTWPALPRDAMCTLTLAAWVAWVACCAQIARAVAAHVRRGEARARTSASFVDRVAARIAVGVLALMSVGAPTALPSTAGASPPPGGAARLATAAGPAARVAPAPPERPTPGVQRATTYEAQPGDTLWSVADAWLGDGADWTSIARHNLGRVMPDGGWFVDPDYLLAGWRLDLPVEGHGDERRVRNLEHLTHPRRSADAGRRGAGGSGRHLPELVALGMGSLACAALARQAALRRRVRPFGADLPGSALTDAAVDAAALVQRFDGLPALHAFEAANTMLGRALWSRSSHPSVRALCVGPSGVTFHLAEPDADPPEGFTAHSDATAWHVEHGSLDLSRPAGTSPPAVPVALPVGDDEEGTWLVGLDAGTVLPILGESALALWRAARTAVRAWTWSDTIVVAEGPDDPALRREAETNPAVARHLLFFGDPRTLPATVAQRIAVVTLAPVAPSNLSILVDRHGATLHPLGRVVRPHVQTAETAQAIEELVDGAPAGGREAPRRRSSHPAPPAEPTGHPAVAGHGALVGAPGTVDVRLLTMRPRLEGLREELPANRARRAVELVAYLALHQPDVVTSDRLRTRVLGSSDADAAAKTLFNTAHAARRAMGVDQRGELLFPSGTRNGLYQLSPAVTVDVHRAAALAAEGARYSETDPDVALGYAKAALELVEGEPLANALSGYSWWEAEGHGARIATVLVDAACTLAALATRRGCVELAWWGIERARLVEPYSEALARAAMRTAAAQGDADRLRLEWRECQRLVDALDPGNAPSPRTESLYGELRRRMTHRAETR